MVSILGIAQIHIERSFWVTPAKRLSLLILHWAVWCRSIHTTGTGGLRPANISVTIPRQCFGDPPKRGQGHTANFRS